MRFLFSLLLSFSVLTSVAQTDPPNRTRSGDAFTQIDNYLVALKRLGIPSGATPTLDATSTPVNSAKLFFNTTDTALYVYREDLQEWLKVSGDDGGISEIPTLAQVLAKGNTANSNKITDLLAGNNPNDAVNKAQLDALESPFNVIDVTQQVYTDKAINVKAFENQLHGTTYQEGAIDFGASRYNIHEMGLYSFKSGIESTASGGASAAFGQSTTASGVSSSAFGVGTTASGDYSSAFGITTTASGVASSAFGNNTTASGDYSSAFGDNTVSNEYASLAIGRFSEVGNAQDSWLDGSPIFKVGNGTSQSNRRNAYVLYNDGRSEQEKSHEITTIGEGVILKSPDGTRWRITVDNSGSLTAVLAN